MKYIILISLFIGMSFVHAESEGKSRDQIEQESDVVFTGIVIKVAKYREIDEVSSYYCVEIELSEIQSGLVSERQLKTLKVYYRNATNPEISYEHAPRLKSGQKVRVFGQLRSGIHDEGFSLIIPTNERVEIL